MKENVLNPLRSQKAGRNLSYTACAVKFVIPHLPTGQAGLMRNPVPISLDSRSPITTFEDKFHGNDDHYAFKKLFQAIFVFCFFLFFSSNAFATDAEDNVYRIQKAYENIKDFKGSFIQKNTIKDLNKTDVYKGSFFIKIPLKMKWIYKGKSSQDITINNDTVLLYKKGDNQAYKGKFSKETYGQTPVALLNGFGNIKEEFNISGKGNSLILKPKKSLGNIISIKITMSDADFPIHSFTIQDGNSNVIEIELNNIEINSGLKDSLFSPSLPKGVSIYEQHT